MLTKLLPQEFNLSKRAKTVIEVSFNVSNFILKPFDCVNSVMSKPSSYESRMKLAVLFSIFEKLWNYKDESNNYSCRDVVVFPAGVIGFPCKGYQPDLYKLVSDQIHLFYTIYKKSMTYPPLSSLSGFPIVLYSILDPLVWKRAVVDIIALFEAAGVIHLDLRLYNIFYSYKNNLMEVKVIDWDDAQFINFNVPATLLSCREIDARFPRENNEKATAAYHAFFIERITKDIMTTEHNAMLGESI